MYVIAASWYFAAGFFVLGAVASIAIEELLRWIVRRAGSQARRSRVGRLVLRRQIARHTKVMELGSRWGTCVGGLEFPWVVAAFGPFRADDIASFYTPEEPAYPQDVDERLEVFRSDIELRAAAGEDVPFDGQGFKLTRFHVSSRATPDELQRLVLHFAPTTFFRMLTTDQRMDEPAVEGTLRERFATDADLRTAPVSQLATHWGVGLSVVTKDRYLLVSERGNTAVDPRVCFPTVAEGGSRAKDSDPNTGAPDHLSIARRGLEEELGVELHLDELTWLSFGANAVLCEYALIGRVDSRFTYDEIERRRSVGVPKDGWEARQLLAIDFQPEDVADFLANADHAFSPFALIAIVHTLIHEFGITHCERALRHVSVTQSEALPWTA